MCNVCSRGGFLVGKLLTSFPQVPASKQWYAELHGTSTGSEQPPFCGAADDGEPKEHRSSGCELEHLDLKDVKFLEKGTEEANIRLVHQVALRRRRVHSAGQWLRLVGRQVDRTRNLRVLEGKTSQVCQCRGGLRREHKFQQRTARAHLHWRIAHYHDGQGGQFHLHHSPDGPSHHFLPGSVAQKPTGLQPGLVERGASDWLLVRHHRPDTGSPGAVLCHIRGPATELLPGRLLLHERDGLRRLEDPQDGHHQTGGGLPQQEEVAVHHVHHLFVGCTAPDHRHVGGPRQHGERSPVDKTAVRQAGHVLDDERHREGLLLLGSGLRAVRGERRPLRPQRPHHPEQHHEERQRPAEADGPPQPRAVREAGSHDGRHVAHLRGRHPHQQQGGVVPLRPAQPPAGPLRLPALHLLPEGLQPHQAEGQLQVQNVDLRQANHVLVFGQAGFVRDDARQAVHVLRTGPPDAALAHNKEHTILSDSCVCVGIQDSVSVTQEHSL
ncbi:hypothetical protein CEXT_757021 [Caerostris extrusa]|uniref:Uncharacterized protein n=1 Tax=Caerostris extrusa TaxID=172846 RepID=A0AAV4YAB5_CAEEX|nr:hypothetical protein CEXT_757021 [Caerostris extrusa]